MEPGYVARTPHPAPIPEINGCHNILLLSELLPTTSFQLCRELYIISPIEFALRESARAH